MAGGTHLLRIYLSDHLAGLVGQLELARRSHRSNKGTRLGEYLQSLAGEFDEERKQLERLIERVGGTRAPYKQAAVWAAEKIGRLKLNGQITGYSPLSRVYEIEGLKLGIEANIAMWHSLSRSAGRFPALASIDYDGMIERSGSQLRELEGHHKEAVETAFGSDAEA
jgi:hypothetical protein